MASQLTTVEVIPSGANQTRPAISGSSLLSHSRCPIALDETVYKQITADLRNEADTIYDAFELDTKILVQAFIIASLSRDASPLAQDDSQKLEKIGLLARSCSYYISDFALYNATNPTVI
jgi:hypothetical protein